MALCLLMSLAMKHYATLLYNIIKALIRDFRCGLHGKRWRFFLPEMRVCGSGVTVAVQAIKPLEEYF